MIVSEFPKAPEAPPKPVPSVGRIVHYQAYGTPGGEFKSLARAAIITEVHEGGVCSVTVFNPTGLFFNKVPFAEVPTPGHWNWPPYVPPVK